MLLYVMSPKNHLSKHWVDERLGDICFRDEVDLGGYVLFFSFYHFIFSFLFSSVRSSNSHPDLLVTHHHHHPLFQITPVLNTGLSLSEPLQLYKGYNAI